MRDARGDGMSRPRKVILLVVASACERGPRKAPQVIAPGMVPIRMLGARESHGLPERDDHTGVRSANQYGEIAGTYEPAKERKSGDSRTAVPK
jgi:hypothetical protein